MERDAFAIWWYNRLQRPGVALESFAHPYLQQARRRSAQVGRRLWLLDLTNDLGIPVFVAVSHDARNGAEDVALGSGAHFDPQIAALRAITELNQSMPVILAADRAGRRMDDRDTGWWKKLKLCDHPYLAPHGETEPTLGSVNNEGSVDQLDEVTFCVELAKGKGLDLLVADQTRPDIGLPVAKVVVPGLRHYWPRFAPGWLYDVPVEMGLLSRKWQEGQLNTLYPAV